MFGSSSDHPQGIYIKRIYVNTEELSDKLKFSLLKIVEIIQFVVYLGVDLVNTK